MCCFSIPVRSVKNTQIFARAGEQGRQYLVYSMALDSPADVAMILPIPTPPRSSEKAVRFLDLSDYPTFFQDMERDFHPHSRGGQLSKSLSDTFQTLKVEQVGSYEASFVPREEDFKRLDPRFRLPEKTWAKLPIYNDYGFAVFKLKAGAHSIHPMAFEFPRRDPQRLFFPTVHIHDGEVHPEADFDHTLYCQKSLTGTTRLTTWKESYQLASQSMHKRNPHGILSPNDHCYRMQMVGNYKNADIYI